MKVIETDSLTARLGGSGSIEAIRTGPDLSLFDISHEIPGWVELALSGNAFCVWPNREGEGFELKSVFPVLRDLQCLESGLSLSWPATASAQAVVIFPQEGPGFLFRAEGGVEGLHREIRIFSDGSGEVRFRFSGAPGRWLLKRIEKPSPPGQTAPDDLSYQFQVGMIGPDGICDVPGERGFDFLADLADRAESLLGPFGKPPLIHVFGYGEGHDRAYPDYTPSPLLGGIEGFKRAVEKLHRKGFLLSCYMNGRIMETSMAEKFPGLEGAVCANPDGSPWIENYHGRSFYVMDPNSELWLTVLEEQALRLKSFGADILQLDQLAGRAAAVSPGLPWGRGYASLIGRLRKRGLRIWIQGVSDYYGADWYEMTWRDVNILPGGIIRGGNPLGKTDLTLSRILMPDNRYLIPLSKLEMTGIPGKGTIIDLMGARGKLPLAGEAYLEELEALSRREFP